jgi:hypothetical protein
MAEVPKPNDIPNVFAMNDPSHMWHKLAWELQHLTTSLSVWEDNDGAPEPLFRAANTAITAWHLSDWLWQSSPEVRKKLAKRFDLRLRETKKGRRDGLRRFQQALTENCKALKICREIANGSKHMRTDNPDEEIRALAKWDPVVEGVGLAEPGDLNLSLMVSDDGKERDAVLWFIDAFGFWEKLITSEHIMTQADRLPNKIIKKSGTIQLTRA